MKIASGIKRGFRPNNRLLSLLPDADLSLISPFLQDVELRPRQILHHWRTPIEEVYFIERGLVSVSARIGAQKSVEVWLIGSEGMSGIPEVLGDDDDPPHRRIVQVAGAAFTISTRDFRDALEKMITFRQVLLRYTEAVLLQTSQLGACNAHHSLKQRLARWLLLARDALNSDELPVTHELLSKLLGVRRASVTECLAGYEEQGLVINTRGLIKIADASKMEQVCCVCYRIINRQYERLLRKASYSTQP